MTINYQENNYSSALQSLKNSFTGISETRTSKQASVVKKVALAVINLLLIPFRLAQSAYYKLFKLKVEPKTGFELNRAAILKTALIGMGAIGLIALGYKPSTQSSQIGLLSGIPKLALGGVVSFCGIGIFALKKWSIKNSEDCRKVIPQDQLKLKVENSASERQRSEKYNEVSPQDQLKLEIENLETAQAQIDFAYALVVGLRDNFADNVTLSNINKSLKRIDENNKLSLVEKADEINKAIIKCLDSDKSEDSLKNSVRELSFTGLKAVLPCIGNFPNLKSLDLSSNQLTKLPDAIRGLENLEELSLANNKLTELPDAIRGLKELKRLDLSSNQLTKLPDAIGGLENLEELNLANNQITELPDAIRGLTKLEKLGLSQNQLTKLPDAISALTKLESLDLGNNQLTELPDAIRALTKLRQLHLSRNQLTELPDAIRGLTKLEGLYLSHNQLTKLPETIVALEELVNLYLGYNRLTELPALIKSLKKLRYLEIIGNQIPDVKADLKNLRFNFLQINTRSNQFFELST